MAAYSLFMEDNNEFMIKLKNRDSDLIYKMTKCVLNAIKRKKESIDIFEITFKDKSTLTWSITKDHYLFFLENSIEDLVKMDTTECYMLCAQIIKIKKKSEKLLQKRIENIKEIESKIDISS